MKFGLTIAATLMLGLAIPSAAYAKVIPVTTVTIGSNSTGNAFPFNSAYLGEYQQVYNGALFSGPVEISAIGFSAATGFSASLISGTYALSLSTTSAATNTLSTVYANNIGAGNSLFFSGTVTNVLSFTGTPFLFDPSQGNLLLDVVVNSSNTQSNVAFAAGCSTDTNRVFNFSGSSSSHGIGGNPGQCTPNSYGLQTQFTVTPVVKPVPEPSTLAILGGGLLGLFSFAVARRRA